MGEQTLFFVGTCRCWSLQVLALYRDCWLHCLGIIEFHLLEEPNSVALLLEHDFSLQAPDLVNGLLQ